MKFSPGTFGKGEEASIDISLGGRPTDMPLTGSGRGARGVEYIACGMFCADPLESLVEPEPLPACMTLPA